MATESVLVSRDTLVRYGNPVVVQRHPEKPQSPIGVPGSHQNTGDIGLPPTEKAKSTEEVLNCILPPREWEENGQLWRQTVSSEPATREDVKKLGEQLDTGLQQQQARETGICPVRRRLFNQCFDEIIRQVYQNLYIEMSLFFYLLPMAQRYIFITDSLQRYFVKENV